MNRQKMIEKIHEAVNAKSYNDVMISDVLDYMCNNNLMNECMNIISMWNNKKYPIYDEQEKLITYIYDLITKQ